jgi:hypothetical protein
VEGEGNQREAHDAGTGEEGGETYISMTLVEISGQKWWTMELRLASAWSLSSGAGSCSNANSEPAELTAAAAMLSPTLLRLRLRLGSPPPQGVCDLACERRGFSVRRGALGAPRFCCRSSLLGAEEDHGFVAVEGGAGSKYKFNEGQVAK